jgi:uncharacterized phage protein (TIGR02220 family)
MARARNIKPGFFKNDLLAECKPLSRLLFAGLWTIADKAGRLENRIKRIKAEILPYDNCNVDELLKEIESKGFVTVYEISGQSYIQVNNWGKHQNPHVKEPESIIPEPYKTGASMVQTPDKPDAKTPDSLNLIPDSLNPITDIPYSEILLHLNQVCKTKYKLGEANKKHIRARWNEKYTIDDFKTVIDKKAAEWLGTDRAQYLRPETLFGTKFDSYLNQISGGANGANRQQSRADESKAKYNDDEYANYFK